MISNLTLNTFSRKKLAIATMSAMIGIAAPIGSAFAQNNSNSTLESTQHEYDISPQGLGDALIQFGRQSGIEVVSDSRMLANKRTTGVQGTMTLQQAAILLFTNTGLNYRLNGSTLSVVEATQGQTINNSSNGITELAPATVNATNSFGDIPEDDGFNAQWQTTATKMALPLIETPQAISVVTRDSLDARQVLNLQSAIELTPGLSNGASNANPGTFGGENLRQFGSHFMLRGQNLFGARDIRSDGYSIGSLNTIDLFAYERVEVLRGPSGFYGQGSLGGFINLVRKKPQADFEASAMAQVGSYDTYRSGLDITGSLDTDQNFLGRVTTSYENSGTFVEGAETQRFMIAPSLEAHIGDKTRILAELLYQDEEFIPNMGTPARYENNRFIMPNISRSKVIGVPSEENSIAEVRDARLRLDHEMSDRWMVSLLLNTSQAIRKVDVDSYGVYLNSNGDTYVVAGKAYIDEDRWAGELKLEGKFDAFGREHQIQFGLEKNRRKIHRQNGYTFLDPFSANIYTDDFPTGGPDVNIDWRTDRAFVANNKAIYGQVLLNLHDRTKLLVGVRYDSSDQKSRGFFFGTPENPIDKSDSDTTIRIGLTHDINEHINAYITYAESFNPVNLRRTNGDILDPETGEGYELGLKTEWFNNNLGVNIAAYRADLNKRPIQDPAFPLDRVYVSSGLHRTDGIELEITGSPYPGLTISASTSWMNNEFLDRPLPNYSLSIDGSIDKQYSLYANYEIQNGALQGFSFGATLVNVGERNYINTRPDPQEQRYADGYDRMDLNFSYSGLQNWDMNFLIRNVLDEIYVEQSTGTGAAGNYFGSPRAYLFQAEYHF